MERYYDIAVIGAGPAGLAAAITAKSTYPAVKTVVLEKKEKPAKKLRASGNGRGNLSNEKCVNLEEVLGFFAQSGIAVRKDSEGRIYPYSEEAEAAAEALVKRAARLGADILTDSEVKSVEADSDGGFRVFISGKGREASLRCSALLIATGGKSFAVYGSSGDGYRLAESLGHAVTPTVPALTAVEVKEDIKEMKGVRVKGCVSLFEGGNLVFKESGEIQFREDSISGICVMDLSSALPAAESGSLKNIFDGLRIAVNFVPDFGAAGLLSFLGAKKDVCGISACDLLETIVRDKAVPAILKRAGVEPCKEARLLTAGELLNIANALRSFSLTPCGRKGWKEAQVTKGGVVLKEICEDTMESRIIPGLYFAGEVLDYDGPCGGYNLHNAWLTGIRAGKAAAERIRKRG